MIVSQFFGSAMGFVSVFSGEKAVFLREYSAGYYSLLPYYLSKTLMEVTLAHSTNYWFSSPSRLSAPSCS